MNGRQVNRDNGIRGEAAAAGTGCPGIIGRFGR